MKVLVLALLAAVVAVTMAQRPSYADRDSDGYPGLANRFKTDEDDEEAEVSLNNRVGETDATSTTIRLPVDALGEAALVDRISKWPKEQQPFWYLNHEIIEASRGRPVPGSQPTPRPVVATPNVAQRSSFISRRSVRR